MQTSPTVAQSSMVTEVTSWLVLGFLALMGLVVIYYIYTEKINLSRLISEPNGDASMSRFQLLIFTFVIAASLFLIIASGRPPQFPGTIPQGVLILLGISSSSYLVSKGIQFSSEEGTKERAIEVVVNPSTAKTTAGGGPVQFSVKVLRSADQSVRWSIEPANAGSINDKGLYTPPKEVQGQAQVVVRATSAADSSASNTATITVS